MNYRIWLLLSINYKNSVNVAVFWGYKYDIRNRILLIRWKINMFHLLMCCNDKMNPMWLQPICNVLSAHSWMCLTSCSVTDKTQPARANKRKNTWCKINHKLKQMSRIRAVCTSVFVQRSPLRRDDTKSLTDGVECGKYAGASYCLIPRGPRSTGTAVQEEARWHRLSVIIRLSLLHCVTFQQTCNNPNNTYFQIYVCVPDVSGAALRH